MLFYFESHRRSITCCWVILHAIIFSLEISASQQPPNDSCENAILLDPTLSSASVVVTGSTANATIDGLNLCGENLVNSPGVWYYYQSDDDDNDSIIHATTCTEQTTFDTALTIYSGFCGSSLQCVAGRDDDIECDVPGGKTHHSSVSWRAEGSKRYYILIHGSEAGHVGNFGLIVTETEPFDNDTDDDISSASTVTIHWPTMIMASLHVFNIVSGLLGNLILS